jgi:phage/plasmid-like protein (TIGR03299 family)
MTATLETTTEIAPTNEIATEADGTTSFSARQLPWMKVGTVIDTPKVTAAEAARMGGIDFDVELRSISFRSGNTTKTIPHRKAVVRKDTDDFFSVVSTGYKVVQYSEAFEFMDGISPSYVSAGSFGGGKQGFMVVQLDGLEHMNVEVNGVADPHDLYVVFRTSHDLSKAIEVSLMPLRGLCMNQLGLRSFSKGAKQRWSIKHVGDTAKKLAAAQDTLKNSAEYSKLFAGMAQQLGSVSVSADDFDTVLKRILPDKPRRDDQITAIQSAFAESPVVGFGGTGWGAMNAVSEYFQWQRNEGTRTAASIFTSGLSGDTNKYVNRTAQLLLSR